MLHHSTVVLDSTLHAPCLNLLDKHRSLHKSLHNLLKQHVQVPKKAANPTCSGDALMVSLGGKVRSLVLVPPEHEIPQWKASTVKTLILGYGPTSQHFLSKSEFTCSRDQYTTEV